MCERYLDTFLFDYLPPSLWHFVKSDAPNMWAVWVLHMLFILLETISDWLIKMVVWLWSDLHSVSNNVCFHCTHLSFISRFSINLHSHFLLGGFRLDAKAITKLSSSISIHRTASAQFLRCLWIVWKFIFDVFWRAYWEMLLE